jgi:hypothetical protein
MAQQMYALVENRPGNRMIGQPFYIGIGTPRRPRLHLTHAKYGRHCNEDVQKVITRHWAVDAEPLIQTLVIGSREYIADLEQKAIKFYGRRQREDERGLLCNLAKGGHGADPELMANPKIRAKIAAASKAMHQRLGHREDLSRKSKAAYASQELRDRVGAATKVALAKPENRERLLIALKRVHAKRTPEQYSKYAKKARDRHPERAEADRLRMLARQAAIAADPVKYAATKEARRQSAIAQWAHPARRTHIQQSLKGVAKTITPAAKAARAKAVDAMLAARGYSRKPMQNAADGIVEPDKAQCTHTKL